MEQNLNQNTAIYIDAEIKANFLVVSKWIKFLSVMGFIGMGILLVAGIGMVIAGLVFSTSMPGSIISLTVLGLVYVILSGLHIVPLYYFFKSAVEIKKGLLQNNQLEFSSGVAYLKSHYKFVGIYTIVILSIYLLIFIGTMFLAVSRF